MSELFTIYDATDVSKTLGPSKAPLCKVFEQYGRRPKEPFYARLYKSGLNTTYLTEVEPQEANTIENLLKKGVLVPTFDQNYMGTHNIRLIQHFEDVRFGIDAKTKRLLIYNFSEFHGIEEQVLYLGDIHEVVRKRLNDTLEKEYYHFRRGTTVDVDEDAPFKLKDDLVILPILTDPQTIELRRRQKEFTP